MASSVDLDAFGQRLRTARESRGWTLDQFAQQAGLSKAHLSRLESGERQASIGALVDLSTTLGVRISALLGEDTERNELATFAPETPRHAAGGLEITTCSGYAESRAIEALRVTVSPDRAPSAPAVHHGEEFLYVLHGPLELEYDGVLHELATDTTAHFDARRPHRMTAPGTPAEVLMVCAEDRLTLSRIKH
jgi:transcriptional regulator with XRE-family HTH domain